MRFHQHIDLLLRFDRGLALQQAIGTLVTRGSIVIDAGAGSGFLSVLAAKAGAKRVWAVDIAPLDGAAALARANGFEINCVRADLNSWQPSERADVLIAMVYFNDPRRDIAQSRMVNDLATRVLKDDGRVLPDRVTYSAALMEWPEQDYPTRTDRLWKNIETIGSRYRIEASPLAHLALSEPDPAWFPARLPSGALSRASARTLSEETHAWETRYGPAADAVPAGITLRAVRPGIANAVVWTQRLWSGDTLIFSNESVSWLRLPRSVRPEETIELPLDAQWHSANVLG
ncbi:MAG: 50S ribosomal protein L11 methyltransferase [Steroidobacteraceae bacterium]